jgi:hypothetical protein
MKNQKAQRGEIKKNGIFLQQGCNFLASQSSLYNE